MKLNEREEPQDDLEFEITSLDEAEGDAPLATRLPEKPIFLLRKHKGLVTVTSTLLVILAILLILFSVAPIRQLIIPAPVQNTFDYRLDASPPWGHLFVDEQPANLSSTTAYPMFGLTRGEHTLLWRADPFAPQQCVVMVPVGSGIDSCKHPQIPPVSGNANSYISFPVGLDKLPPAQSAALLQTTQTTLDSQQSSEMMRTGDLYAQTSVLNPPSCTILQSAALCLANAHQPLKATLRLQLDTTSWSRISCWRGECESNGPNCHIFCNPFLYAAPDVHVAPTLWQAIVYVQLFWSFSTLDGRVVADNQADTFIRGQQNDIAVPLNITWNGQRWSVSMAMSGDYTYSGGPVCEAAMGDLYNLENAVLAASNQEAQTTLNPIQGTTFASGCLIEFKLQSGAFPVPTPSSSPPLVVHVIQRFGVLLAVDSAAHHLFPFLPVATSYEKQLAQQWEWASRPSNINVQVNVISG